MAPQNILIIGCSVAGPALASFILLCPGPASEKPAITILEQAKQIRTEGQNIDLRGAGVTLMKKLGIEKAVRAAVTGEEGVQHVDGQNRVWGALAADRTGKTSTATADIEILRGTLAKICYERSRTLGEAIKKEGGTAVEYIFGDTLDQINQDGDQVTVRFKKSQETRSFDLVVGADGLQSKTRAMVFGEAAEKERIHELGLYGSYFSMPRGPTDNEWRRWYHAPGGKGIMLRPSQFPDRTTVFMTVLNTDDARLRDVAARDRRDVQAQKTLQEEYFKNTGWESDRVLKAMWEAKDYYYDMIAQIKMEKWSKGRVVLLGDAAWCASPLSGMGTTLAFSGAYNLAGALHQHGNDYTAAFTQFEETMRPNVIKAQKLAPGMPWLLWPQTQWGVWAFLCFAWFMANSGILTLAAKLGTGPPASSVPVEDYGLRDAEEMDVLD